jgi:hypothetical protein
MKTGTLGVDIVLLGDPKVVSPLPGCVLGCFAQQPFGGYLIHLPSILLEPPLLSGIPRHQFCGRHC